VLDALESFYRDQDCLIADAVIRAQAPVVDHADHEEPSR
jgi:hypothetical protein